MNFVKVGNWVPNGQKKQSSSKKGPKGVQNQKISFISGIVTLSPKNLQMLRTNWYNCFKKSCMS